MSVPKKETIKQKIDNLCKGCNFEGTKTFCDDLCQRRLSPKQIKKKLGMSD